MEVGMRGSAMVRGTGTPTAFGFNLAQQNMFALRKMQMSGALTPETINQFGGITGAQESLTGQLVGLQQSQLGQGLAALLIGPGGKGINQGVYGQLAGGGGLAGAFASSNIDPMQINSVSAAQMWNQMGPEQYQTMVGGILRGQMQWAGREFGMTNPESQMQMALRSVGLPTNAQNISMWSQYVRSMPGMQIQASMATADATRQTAYDEVMRRNTIAELSGINPAGRWIRRNVTGPVANEFSMMGRDISRAVSSVGNWARGIEPYEALDVGTIESAALYGGPGKSYRTGYEVTSEGFDIASKLGLTGGRYAGSGKMWNASPTEKATRGFYDSAAWGNNWNAVSSEYSVLTDISDAISRAGPLSSKEQAMLAKAGGVKGVRGIIGGEGMSALDFENYAGERSAKVQARYVQGIAAIRGATGATTQGAVNIWNASVKNKALTSEFQSMVGGAFNIDLTKAKADFQKKAYDVMGWNDQTTKLSGDPETMMNILEKPGFLEIAAKANAGDAGSIAAVSEMLRGSGATPDQQNFIMNKFVEGVPQGVQKGLWIPSMKTSVLNKMDIQEILEGRGLLDRVKVSKAVQGIFTSAAGGVQGGELKERLAAIGSATADPMGQVSSLLQWGLTGSNLGEIRKLRGKGGKDLDSVIAGLEVGQKIYEQAKDMTVDDLMVNLGIGPENRAKAEAIKAASSGGDITQASKLLSGYVLGRTERGTRPDTASAAAAGDATYRMMLMKDPYQAQVYQGMSNVNSSLGAICKLLNVPTEKG